MERAARWRREAPHALQAPAARPCPPPTHTASPLAQRALGAAAAEHRAVAGDHLESLAAPLLAGLQQWAGGRGRAGSAEASRERGAACGECQRHRPSARLPRCRARLAQPLLALAVVQHLHRVPALELDASPGARGVQGGALHQQRGWRGHGCVLRRCRGVRSCWVCAGAQGEGEWGGGQGVRQPKTSAHATSRQSMAAGNERAHLWPGPCDAFAALQRAPTTQKHGVVRCGEQQPGRTRTPADCSSSHGRCSRPPRCRGAHHRLQPYHRHPHRRQLHAQQRAGGAGGRRRSPTPACAPAAATGLSWATHRAPPPQFQRVAPASPLVHGPLVSRVCLPAPRNPAGGCRHPHSQPARQRGRAATPPARSCRRGGVFVGRPSLACACRAIAQRDDAARHSHGVRGCTGVRAGC